MSIIITALFKHLSFQNDMFKEEYKSPTIEFFCRRTVLSVLFAVSY